VNTPEEPDGAELPPPEPTRELLLAQALDACIAAERLLPGSAEEIIAAQPVWARADLRRLVGLAGSLDAAATNAVMAPEFRVAGRRRLMRHIGGDASAEPPPLPTPPSITPLPTPNARRRALRWRGLRWLWRGTASLL
jgi:hypothetical protein